MMRRFGLMVVALAAAGCAGSGGSTVAGTTTTTLPTASGQQVVVQGPARGTVNHTVRGEVTKIDRNDGEINVKTPDGSEVKLRLPPVALATIREGDRVQMDVTVTPR